MTREFILIHVEKLPEAWGGGKHSKGLEETLSRAYVLLETADDLHSQSEEKPNSQGIRGITRKGLSARMGITNPNQMLIWPHPTKLKSKSHKEQTISK